jgi:RHS repeat-associated protein
MKKLALSYLVFLIVISFSYDANGNQTSAPNGLTITYNSINQPQQVKSGSTVKHKFAYLVDGRKLHFISDPANDGGLAYIGSSVFKIYRGKYDGFESTSFSAGRIVRSGSSYAVQYHITDHLGSVRMVLNQSMTVIEQNDYYPFGMRRSISSSTTNRYHYNGKEDISATATSDYGARQYSAEFCQWMQVDPLAEKYYSNSPYGLCVGNPIGNVDLDGRDWIKAVYNGEAFYYYDANVHSDDDVKRLYYNSDNKEVRNYYYIEYVGETGSYCSEADGAFEFYSDGTYSRNGTKQSSEYSNDGSLHVGSSENTKPHGGKPNNNWYGNYLGPNNPHVNSDPSSPYSYAIPPIDDLDYAAFQHDKGYDLHGAAGRLDAITNLNVVNSDWNLAYSCFNISDDGSSRKRSWAKKTGIAFFSIALDKERVRWTRQLLKPKK